MMSEANKRTLATYNNGVNQYIDGTVQETNGFQKQWLDEVFEAVPLDAAILEIGSAFGRDANYLIERGYSPDLTDASSGFVEYLNKQGLHAELLNIIENKPEKMYDVILACAVFLHFTDEDFARAVKHVQDSLKKDGIFAFSVKQGEDDGWTDEKMSAERYFNFWRADRLQRKLTELGMQVVDLQDDGSKWLHVVSKKTDE